MTTHTSAQAALLARIVTPQPAPPDEEIRTAAEIEAAGAAEVAAAAEAEAVAEGLSDCVEQSASGRVAGATADGRVDAADEPDRIPASGHRPEDDRVPAPEEAAAAPTTPERPAAEPSAADPTADAAAPLATDSSAPPAADAAPPPAAVSGLPPAAVSSPPPGAVNHPPPAAVSDPRAAAVSSPPPAAVSGLPPVAVSDPASAPVSGPPAVAVSGLPPAAEAARRRGPADPVRGVMHRHEALCAGAVDVLEIAAGLEAHGVTDQVAGRFRHRDVFSLADELYARVPRTAAGERPTPRTGPVRVGLSHVVPGAGCAVAAALVTRSPAVGAVIALLAALATWAVLRRGPLRTGSRAGALAGGCLLAVTLVEPPATAPFVALALTLAPAAWCAHRFALRARAELAAGRGLAEFAARVRPLLAGTLALYLLVLLGCLWAAAALAGPAGVAEAGALGMLLFTARLLAVHGFTGAAAWGTGVAAAVEAAALGAAALHRVPGLAALSAPAERLGPAAIPVLACGCAAAVLVVHAFRTLTRASAHGTAARPRPTDLRNPNQEQR
ncbi:hypothetical protein ABZ721_35925 [Streptomyces sp. NPDC006733]|uniref:hypothetical protein n=1 Tax=Streptomyces sp. NPDC006733 TaxID=3155460 RepID=UPI0033D32BCE